MKFQKKYVGLSALVLALAAAVYVNWQFSGTDSSVTSKELGAASYVSATAASSTADEAVQTAAITKEQENFFATERTKRQSTQDKIMDDAQKVFDLDTADDSKKSEAQQNVEEIIKIFTIQDSIESIVKAKGFSECLCYISDEGVTVIVPNGELNDTSALLIDDAVTSHYNVDYSDISIVGA